MWPDTSTPATLLRCVSGGIQSHSQAAVRILCRTFFQLFLKKPQDQPRLLKYLFLTRDLALSAEGQTPGGVWDHAPGSDTAVPEAREAFLAVCVAVHIAVASGENPLQPGRLTRLPCLSLSSLTWPFICSLKKLLSGFKFRLFEIARRF